MRPGYSQALLCKKGTHFAEKFLVPRCTHGRTTRNTRCGSPGNGRYIVFRYGGCMPEIGTFIGQYRDCTEIRVAITTYQTTIRSFVPVILIINIFFKNCSEQWKTLDVINEIGASTASYSRKPSEDILNNKRHPPYCTLKVNTKKIKMPSIGILEVRKNYSKYNLLYYSFANRVLLSRIGIRRLRKRS